MKDRDESSSYKQKWWLSKISVGKKDESKFSWVGKKLVCMEENIRNATNKTTFPKNVRSLSKVVQKNQALKESFLEIG